MYTLEKYHVWADEKFAIHTRKAPTINHRQIWLAKIGINIGCEENGKSGFLRPVMIVRKVGSLAFVVPMTTQGKEGPYYYSIKSIQFADKLGNGFESRLLLSQARTIDPKRLISYIDAVSPEEYLSIKKHLREIYLPGV